MRDVGCKGSENTYVAQTRIWERRLTDRTSKGDPGYPQRVRADHGRPDAKCACHSAARATRRELTAPASARPWCPLLRGLSPIEATS
jgi:hypothetical protein